MKCCVHLILLLLSFSLLLDMDTGLEDKDTLVTQHFDELLSLSELPMQKLLHVKRSFADSEPEDNFVHSPVSSHGVGEENAPTDRTDLTPEALALVSPGGGHTRRINPLLNNRAIGRLKTSLRRGGGGGSGHGGDSGGKSKSKKGSISSIFQMSITSLAFLAFGGYLLCLIIKAVRGNNEMMMMNSQMAPPANFVVVGRRPFRKRRKRESTEEKNNGSYTDRNTRKEIFTKLNNAQYEEKNKDLDKNQKSLSFQLGENHKQLRESKLSRYADQLTETYKKEKYEYTPSNQFTGEAINILNESTKGILPKGKGRYNFNNTEDKKNVIDRNAEEDISETVDSEEFSDSENSEHKLHENLSENEMEFGHSTQPNIDSMYRALIMISEGYSLYHQAIYTR